MAMYKYTNHLQQSPNECFDKEHHPAEQTPYSGIYRCTGCGLEVVSTKEHPLPPQNHHQHSNSKPIRWKLNVAAHQVA